MQEKEQKISPIKQRILQFADSLGISKRDFYKEIGVSRGTLEAKTGITEDVMAKFITTYPDVSTDWLVKGEGEIFRTKSIEKVVNLNDHPNDHPNDHKRKVQKRWSNESEINHVFKLRTDRIIDKQMIPIYDMEAVAGLVSLFTDSHSQTVIEVMETSLIPKCDGGIRIVGDSMYPLLKSGDVVFYKQINDIRNAIIWGEMYLISFENDGEEYVAVKYIKKAPDKDFVTLVSYNEHHAPLEIHIGRIRALAFIKASLRLNSLK